MVATVAGPTVPAALAAALVAAGANGAALLAAADAAALVAALEAAGAAAAALVAGKLDVAALLEDFLLAQPATTSAAIPTKTVALIAVDDTRIAFFIL